jgi:hypothetical protein
LLGNFKLTLQLSVVRPELLSITLHDINLIPLHIHVLHKLSVFVMNLPVTRAQILPGTLISILHNLSLSFFKLVFDPLDLTVVLVGHNPLLVLNLLRQALNLVLHI